MKSQQATSSKPVVLFTGPAAFRLPALSLEALAASCYLRFRRIDHTVAERVADVDSAAAAAALRHQGVAHERVGWNAVGPLRAPVVFAPADDGRIEYWPPEDFFSEARVAKLDSGLQDEHVALTQSFDALLRAQLLPALELLWLLDDATFAEIEKAWAGDRPSLWSRLLFPTAARRAARVAELRSRCGAGTVEGCVAAIKRGMRAVELALSRGGAVFDAEAPTYFLGLTRPTTVDCFAFAACAAALTAEFPPTSIMALIQTELAQQLPRCRQYADAVARQYFDRYAGIYLLDLPPKREPIVDPYAPGRRQVVLGTLAATAVFFTLSNLESILSVLLMVASVVAGDDDEEGEWVEVDEGLLTEAEALAALETEAAAAASAANTGPVATEARH